jgi:hypothetical protein
MRALDVVLNARDHEIFRRTYQLPAKPRFRQLKGPKNDDRFH